MFLKRTIQLVAPTWKPRRVLDLLDLKDSDLSRRPAEVGASEFLEFTSKSGRRASQTIYQLITIKASVLTANVALNQFSFLCFTTHPLSFCYRNQSAVAMEYNKYPKNLVPWLGQVALSCKLWRRCLLFFRPPVCPVLSCQLTASLQCLAPGSLREQQAPLGCCSDTFISNKNALTTASGVLASVLF